MKILLVNAAPTFYTNSFTTSAPLGLMSIATYCQQHGHTVQIHDRTIKHASLKKVLRDFSPDVVGVSYFALKQTKDAIKVSAFCKKKGLPVIWGGQMATVLNEEVLATGVVDYISMGEGEATTLELLDVISGKKAPETVNGLAFLKDGKVHITKHRDFLDLAELPLLDWSFIRPELYFQSSFGCDKMMYVYISKGCPGHCTFCINPPFHRSTYRKRPLEHVFADIEFLMKNHGLDGVYFAADVLFLSKKEMHEFCEERKRRGLTFFWGGQTKIGIFDEEDFAYMHANGCRWLFFGVETGSPEMLKKVKKSMNLDLVEETFAACAEAGIVTIASFIVSFPDETYDDIMKTINLALSLKSTMYNFNCLSACPGAEIWDTTRADGSFSPPKSLLKLAKIPFIDEPVPHLSNIPKKDIIIIRDYFQWLSFTSPQTSADGKKTLFAKKAIIDTIKLIFSGGPIKFFVLAFSAAIKFLSVFSNVHFHPKTRKKYKIYKKR